jgi:hypothetical protein
VYYTDEMTVVKDFFVFLSFSPKEKAPFPAFVMQMEKGACTYTISKHKCADEHKHIEYK